MLRNINQKFKNANNKNIILGASSYVHAMAPPKHQNILDKPIPHPLPLESG